jgi:hypothetical protein
MTDDQMTQLAELLERGGESAERIRLHYMHFRDCDRSEAAWDRYCASNPKNTRAENWRRREP